MFSKIASLGGLLGPKIDHPLADPKELRRVLAELPVDNGLKTLDEIAGWLESLQGATDFPGELLLGIVKQLDEAAQNHLRRLTRDYLRAPRLSQTEEKHLRTLIRGVWSMVAAGYELGLKSALAKGKLSDSLRESLPVLWGRLVAALAAVNKWDYFQYGPFSSALWAHMGAVVLMAENAGVANAPVQLYSQVAATTTVLQEYVKALAFQACSMDCLRPLEIELAEKLVAHYQPYFIFGPEGRPESVYWVDLTKAQPPMRLARMPEESSPGLRFFQPGGAHAQLEQLAKRLESGGDVPGNLNLGGQYSARALLPVVRHLAAYLAPKPPQRQHRRHQVKHRMAVLGGMAAAQAVFAGEQGARDMEKQMESWVVEDVSLGGFGTVVTSHPPQWLKIGALLALQPAGGENWLLGIVRRCYRDRDGNLRVGIETLGKQVDSVTLRQSTAGDETLGQEMSGLWIQDGNPAGETRFVLPLAAFDARQSLEMHRDGRRLLLNPTALIEHGGDYDVARYRVLAAE